MRAEPAQYLNIRTWASLAVAVSGAMWGCFWLPLRWISDIGLGGGWVSAVCFLTAALAALPFLLHRAAWQGFASQLLTGTLLGLAFSLYTVSLVLTDVINAILLFYLTPVWSTLAGVFLLGERLTAARAVAIALGFCGMAFILGFDQGLPMPRNTGDWLALVSGMIWAAGTMRSFHKPARGIALPFFTFGIGGLAASLIIAFVALGVGSDSAAAADPYTAIPWAVAMALVFFVPPNFLVLWAAQRIDSGRVGILLMTEVLMGAVTAALLSGEPFGVMQIAGTACIAAAAFIEVASHR
jgi:drug/metabolite transporter (DMT)-like permease